MYLLRRHGGDLVAAARCEQTFIHVSESRSAAD